MRSLNNLVCRFAMARDWPWLFNLTGWIEYNLDLYHTNAAGLDAFFFMCIWVTVTLAGIVYLYASIGGM